MATFPLAAFLFCRFVADYIFAQLNTLLPSYKVILVA